MDAVVAPVGAHLTKQKATITTLQAGRAVAALAVVSHHAVVAVDHFVGSVPSSVERVLGLGYLGVDFFFVLSGFIIYYTNQSRGEGWSRKYLISRAVRIYVPYLPIGIAMAMAYTILPALSAGDRSWSWFASLTLAPTDSPTALSVAWTLRHELVFYFIFWLAVQSGRPFLLISFWSATIIAYNALFGVPEGAVSFLLAARNLEFLFGMSAAWLVITNKAEWPSSLFGILAMIVLAFVVLAAAGPQVPVLTGLALALVLVPIVREERLGRLRAGPVLMLLGNASYSIYLVHGPIISIGTRLTSSLPWLLALALVVVVSTVAGLLFHLTFERPALKLLSGPTGKDYRKGVA